MCGWLSAAHWYILGNHNVGKLLFREAYTYIHISKISPTIKKISFLYGWKPVPILWFKACFVWRVVSATLHVCPHIGIWVSRDWLYMGEEGKRSAGVVESRNLCEIPRVSACFWMQVCEGDHPARDVHPNMLSSLRCLRSLSPITCVRKKLVFTSDLTLSITAQRYFLITRCTFYSVLISQEVWAVTLLLIRVLFCSRFLFEKLQVSSCKQLSGFFIVQYNPVA